MKLFFGDGTVLDTERFPLEAWPEVSRKHGYPVTAELAGRLVGINEADERAILRNEFGAAYPYNEIRDEAGALFREKARRDGARFNPASQAKRKAPQTARIGDNAASGLLHPPGSQ